MLAMPTNKQYVNKTYISDECQYYTDSNWNFLSIVQNRSTTPLHSCVTLRIFVRKVGNSWSRYKWTMVDEDLQRHIPTPLKPENAWPALHLLRVGAWTWSVLGVGFNRLPIGPKKCSIFIKLDKFWSNKIYYFQLVFYCGLVPKHNLLQTEDRLIPLDPPNTNSLKSSFSFGYL